MATDQTRTYEKGKSAVFRMTNGDFGALSNMAPNFPILANGVRISTVEALYQACRYPDYPEIQTIIVDQPSPMTAKMKSKKYLEKTREDWDGARLGVMRWCLRAKLLQHWKRFGEVLKKTGDLPIVEESVRDAFWGAKPNEGGILIGMNVLGRLLMELRQEYFDVENGTKTSLAFPKISNLLFLGRELVLDELRDDQYAEIQIPMFARSPR